ncbi:MAG: LVIVD repeat-containing protein [Sphingobacterium composti]
MNLIKSFLFLGLAIGCLSGCDKVERNTYYKVSLPVLEKMADIRAKSLTTVAPKPLTESGKIYIFKDYLFINEPLKGIHIYNNSNPATPKPISFLNIPGNVDMAVKDNVLYADSFVDLLTFDLSHPDKPTLLNRIEDVFKQLYYYDIETKTMSNVAVEYVDTVLNREDFYKYNPHIKHNFEMVNYDAGSGVGSYGQGGSMARFTLANDHLYTVDNSSLNLFDVSDKTKPSFKKNIMLGWGIETIFPYKNNLFIGSNSGMFIYNIDSAAEPKQESVYSHLRACDPVVVNDDYAFVTLRTGAACAGVVNVLEIVDIKDLKNPKLLKTFQMQNPHGLGLATDVLYICEGKFGFKSFDAKDVTKVGDLQLEHLKDLHSTDVIPGPKSLIVIGENGVCQYDYANKSKLRLLSCISVNSTHD